MDGENGIYLSVVSQCVNCAAASAKDTEKRKKIAGKNDFRDSPPVSPIVVFFLASLFNFWFASLSIRSEPVVLYMGRHIATNFVCDLSLKK